MELQVRDDSANPAPDPAFASCTCKYVGRALRRSGPPGKIDVDALLAALEIPNASRRSRETAVSRPQRDPDTLATVVEFRRYRK
jgi:hypothetical protein